MNLGIKHFLSVFLISGLLIGCGTNHSTPSEGVEDNSSASNQPSIELSLLAGEEWEKDDWSKVVIKADGFYDTIKVEPQEEGYRLKFNKEMYFDRQREPLLLKSEDCLLKMLKKKRDLAGQLNLKTTQFEQISLTVDGTASENYIWVEQPTKYYLERNWISSSVVVEFDQDGDALDVKVDDELAESVVKNKLADWLANPEAITSDLWDKDLVVKYWAACDQLGVAPFDNGLIYYSFTSGRFYPILAFNQHEANEGGGATFRDLLTTGIGLATLEDGVASYAGVLGQPVVCNQMAEVAKDWSVATRVEDGVVGQFVYPSTVDLAEFESVFTAKVGAEIRDGKIRFAVGDYEIHQDWVIPSGYELIIEDGVNIWMDHQISVLSYSPVQIKGDERGVRIKSFQADQPFSAFAVVGNGADSCVITGLEVYQGHESRINGLYFSGAFDLYHTHASLTNCKIHDNKADDGLNIKYGNILIKDCHFYQNYADQVDLDFCNGLVLNTQFDNNKGDSNGDGLDFSGSLVRVDGCSFNKFTDKGISIGEQSTPLIVNCTFTGNNLGIAVKDMSVAHVSGCSFTENKVVFALYRKKQIFGGSNLKLYSDNTYENNGQQFELDEESKVDEVEGSVGPEIADDYWQEPI